MANYDPRERRTIIVYIAHMDKEKRVQSVAPTTTVAHITESMRKYLLVKDPDRAGLDYGLYREDDSGREHELPVDQRLFDLDVQNMDRVVLRDRNEAVSEDSEASGSEASDDGDDLDYDYEEESGERRSGDRSFAYDDDDDDDDDADKSDSGSASDDGSGSGSGSGSGG
eukprot:CAMPEP_0198339768 /NCGR_PEP_ID=MMETSP1450-20131203/41481_1 /TAXON_ID=753684 ORGANISM="Madagascaria erythrocladiodes, Strain CCMP3234" /NCGR_SAMPLE_ID=MMETSP1450 /ASSEMBLY_ACC=CAM_ASM_001115 /LENGTH=168 /DNA_ID=CAMNT_0044044717 /DNA_START=105 /DNA_END=607 /DNA_ORIENTATION=-